MDAGRRARGPRLDLRGPPPPPRRPSPPRPPLTHPCLVAIEHAERSAVDSRSTGGGATPIHHCPLTPSLAVRPRCSCRRKPPSADDRPLRFSERLSRPTEIR